MIRADVLRAALSEESWPCNVLQKINVPASRSWPKRRGRRAKAAAPRSCAAERRRHRTYDQGLMVYLWCANDVHPRGAYQYFTIPAGEFIGTS